MSQIGGGGLKIKLKCLKFNFGHLKTHGGGVSIFQKCLNFKLGLLKADGGGSHFGENHTFFLKKSETFPKMWPPPPPSAFKSPNLKLRHFCFCFGSKNFRIQKNFASKHFWVQKNVGFKKC